LKQPDNQPFDSHPPRMYHRNPRLDHALSYCAIRAMEMDMGLKRYTLTVNNFGKHALGDKENKTHGAGA